MKEPSSKPSATSGAIAPSGAASPGAAGPGLVGADDELIVRAATGDQHAWALLVDRHLAAVTASAWYMLGDRFEAEDIAQETFLRLMDKAPEWEPEGHGLRAWLHRVTVNLCIDRRRKKTPVPLADLPERADGGAAAADDRFDARRAVRRALDDLPARQRAVMVLTYYQGFSNREAGELLDLSVEGVESLLARARRHLRRRLQPLKHDLMGEKR